MDNTTDSMDMNLSKLWEILKDREVWHAALQGGRKKPDATKQHIYMYG